MLASFDILATKLHPPVRRGTLLTRAALLRRLDGALDRALTLIAAPAGYGKTTLAADWLRSQGDAIAAAWVSLDEDDNDPIRFFTYVIAGIQRAVGISTGFGDSLLALLHSPETPPPRAIVNALLNELNGVFATDGAADNSADEVELVPTDVEDRGKPLVLVLDDYTIIQRENLNAAIQHMIDHAPPDLHIVLLTRWEPSLALPKLRLRGDLLELRTDDLRLSDGEIEAFFRESTGIDLPPAILRGWAEQTEGWIGALQLAALSMARKGSTNPFIADAPEGRPYEAAIKAQRRHIADYLMDEVFAQQPPEVQDFLTKTALLDRMCGALCEVVMGNGDGQRMLESLERANLFVVPLDGERRWYRYHHLFRDFLRQRLMTLEAPETVSTLYTRAARWFEAQGLLPEAINSALAAGDERLADELLTYAYAGLLAQGRTATLIRWFERFSDAYGEAHPDWSIRYAGALTYTPRHTRIKALLDSAEPALTALIDHPGKRVFLGWAAAIRAILAARTDHATEALSLAERAIHLLGEDQPYVRALTLIAQGIALLTLEQHTESIATFAEAVEAALSADNPYLAAVGECYIGNIEVLRNNILLARDAFQRALGLLPTVWHGAPPGIIASIGLAYVALVTGDLREAARWIEVSPDPLLEDMHTERRMVDAVCGLARIKVALGDQAGADALMAKLKAALTEQGLGHLYPTDATAAPTVGTPNGMSAGIEALSERELEVLRLIDAGLTNQEIADRLVIALGTVKKHISNLFDKLGATNRTQALARAREYDLL